MIAKVGNGEVLGCSSECENGRVVFRCEWGEEKISSVKC